MHIGQRTAGSWQRILAGALLFALQIQAFGQTRRVDEVINVFLPAPRELRQHLNRARKAIGDKDYSRAVSELGAILTADPKEYQTNPDAGDTPQDFFIEDPENPGTQTSLKAEAQRLLGLLPAQGRSLYELQFGTDARTALQQAIGKGSILELTEVSRKYFHTEAGYEATLLLGRYELDQGRPLASALSLQRLMTTSVAAKLQPDLSILLASAWLYSDMPESSIQVLRELRRTHPQAMIRVGEQKTRLFPESSDPADWLRKLIGHVRSRGTALANQWVMFRGNATRTASGAGGFPMLKSRWRVPTLSTRADEETLAGEMLQFNIDRVAAVPSVHPLAVNQHVVLRTEEGILGVNLKTGKRIWKYPWFQSSDEEYLADVRRGRASAGSGNRTKELRTRFLEDAPFGQLSSDGELVFMVSNLGMTERTGSTALRGGFRRTAPAAPSVYNRLVALELESEGGMSWVVGGKNGTDEPATAGAFFLGPPLPIQGQLYVVAEFNGEIRLVVLNSKTGKHIWSQQLADLENYTVANDRTRRIAGAVPSFANGVLVCPTSAGAVVAVDVATRSLLWGHQYKQLRSVRSNFGVIMTRRSNTGSVGNRWTDGSLTIADGCVIATPVESNMLICLDLLSGKPRWSTKKREDMLYVAGVDNGNLIMVGSESVRAIRLKDGSAAWDDIYEFRDETPTGRGYSSGGFYYVPTTASRIVKLNMKDGSPAGAIPTDKVLGNIISYDGQIISQTATDVRSYFQIGELREQVKKGLVERPDDLWVLKRHAELLLHDRKYNDAMSVLKVLHQRNADDVEIRELLVEALLVNLELDFDKQRAAANEVRPLLEEPEDHARFLRLMSAGQKRNGEVGEAFSTFLQLARLSGERLTNSAVLRQVRPGVRIHEDRWLQGEIASLFAKAPKTQQSNMQKEVDGELKKALATAGLNPLRQFTTYFASYPQVNAAEFELAKRLLGTGETLDAEVLEAEVLLKRVIARKNENSGAAKALLAKLYQGNKRYRLASRTFKQLATEFAEKKLLDGKSGAELAKAAAADAEMIEATKPEAPWKYSPVRVKVESTGNNFRYERHTQVKVDYQKDVGEELTVMINQNQGRLLIRDSYGRIVTNLSLKGPTNNFVVQLDINRCQILGHLLILHLGNEIIAIDRLRATADSDSAILWRKSLFPNGSRSTNNVRPISTPNPWGDRVSRLGGLHAGHMGQISRHGVVFQRQNELVCADLLTGADQWVRHKLPEGCEVYSDDKLVYVFPPEDNRYWSFDIFTGELLSERLIPEAQKRWAGNGDRVLAFKSLEDGQIELQCVELSDGKAIWTKTFPVGSKGSLVGQDRVAVVKPDGQLTMFNWLDGELAFDTRVREAKSLTKLYVIERPKHYLFICHYESRVPNNAYLSRVGAHIPRIAGELYLMDKQNGQMAWPAPVTVGGFLTNLNLPSSVPLITFLRQETASLTRSSQRPISLVAVDLRDGAQVKGPHRVPTSYMGAINISSNPSEQEVYVELSGHKVILQFTDEPRVPAPPRQATSDGNTARANSSSSDPFGARFFIPGAPAQKAGR